MNMKKLLALTVALVTAGALCFAQTEKTQVIDLVRITFEVLYNTTGY